MTGYGTEQHKNPTNAPRLEQDHLPFPNKEWERQTLKNLIESLKRHPDLADKLYATIRVRP